MESINNLSQIRDQSEKAGITLDEALMRRHLHIAEENAGAPDKFEMPGDEQSEQISMLRKENDILGKKYYDLFENSPVGHLALDMTGKILDANNTFSEMLGIPKVFLIGNVIQNLIIERDIDLFYGYVRKLKSTKTKHSLDIRMIKGSKACLDCKLEGKMQFCELYNADVIRVAVIDNTVAKIFEATLRQNESKYRALVEGLDDAVFKLRMPEGTFEYISPSASSVFGHPLSNLFTGVNFIEKIIHQNSLECFNEFMEKMKLGLMAPSYEFCIIDSEDSTRWILITTSPIYDPDGNLISIEGICRNISDIKRYEDSLITSEERFKAISNNSHDWEMWISPDGKPLWVNPSVERITGYSIEECFAMHNYPLALIYEEDNDYVLQHYLESTENLSSIDGLDFRIRRKDGLVVWMSGAWAPIYFSDGSYQGYRLSFRDITEKKETEQKLVSLIEDLRSSNEIINKQFCELTNLKHKLEASQRQLKQLNVKKDEFVSRMSHTLIHSLTRLVELASDLEKDNDAAALEKLVNNAGDFEEHIKESISQIEDYFRWAQSSTTLQ